MPQQNLNRILITGGAGFIGSTVSDYLLNQGHCVLIIDNYETGVKSNNSPHPNLTIIEADISDSKSVNSIFERFSPHSVLHSAASYKDPDNWETDISTNISGTINIVRAATKQKVNRLVYLQTSLCYGLNPLEIPVTLNHPLFSGSSKGGSSYAISKTVGEQYIELSGIDFVSLRLANVYGPRNLSGPLPTFFKNISEGKTCTIVNTRRDFIFINDVVSVIIKSIEGKGTGNYYHVATGKDHAIKELFELAAKALNKTDIQFEIKNMGTDDVKTILLDPSATQKDFNWTPKISFEEGVKRSIEWYKKNPLPITYTHLKNISKKK